MNVGATITGEPTVCDDFPYSGFYDISVGADVWYCWTATCSGPVTIDTCGSTAVDTQVVVYEGCDCMTASYVACSNSDCGEQTIVEFQVVAGQDYLIQIGSRPGKSGDSDTFRIACKSYANPAEGWDYPCNYLNDPLTYSPICHHTSGWDAINSTRGTYVMADDFRPLESGSINHQCWFGAYFGDDGECIRHLADNFQITYYLDNCGAPGAIFAGPFSQGNGSMQVTGPFMTSVELPGPVQEFHFGGDHAPVPVAADQVYWISITNSLADDCGWYWETSPGESGYSIQLDETNDSMHPVRNDLSFCFDIHHDRPVATCIAESALNDHCDMRLPLSLGITEFDTSYATDDNVIILPCDFPLGDEGTQKDIWFSLDHPCSGTARLSTCASAFDTKIAVFLGSSCSNNLGPAIACSDDDCGFENLGSAVELPVSSDFEYKLLVGGYAGSWGTGQLDLHYVVPSKPDLFDFAFLARCFTGDFGSYANNTCCHTQDFDGDGHVSLADAVRILERMNQP